VAGPEDSSRFPNHNASRTNITSEASFDFTGDSSALSD